MPPKARRAEPNIHSVEGSGAGNDNPAWVFKIEPGVAHAYRKAEACDPVNRGVAVVQELLAFRAGGWGCNLQRWTYNPDCQPQQAKNCQPSDAGGCVLRRKEATAV